MQLNTILALIISKNKMKNIIFVLLVLLISSCVPAYVYVFSRQERPKECGPLLFIWLFIACKIDSKKDRDNPAIY